MTKLTDVRAEAATTTTSTWIQKHHAKKRIVYNYKNGTKNKRCWHNSVSRENLKTVISPPLFVFILSLCQAIEQQIYTCFSYDYKRYHVRSPSNHSIFFLFLFLMLFSYFLLHTLFIQPFLLLLLTLLLVMVCSLNIDRLIITRVEDF